MPIQHNSVVYDVNDFKVAALLTDVTTAPTYAGTLTDVPGIASCSMEPNINANELKGDAQVIAKKGNVDKFTFSATYGRLSLDALVIFIGGTVTDTGVTPNQTAKWAIGAVNSLPYFKAMFQILQAEVAAVNVTAWKAQVTGGTLLDQSTDSFGQPTIDFEAIPSVADPAKFVQIELMETATALA